MQTTNGQIAVQEAKLKEEAAFMRPVSAESSVCSTASAGQSTITLSCTLMHTHSFADITDSCR